MEAGAWHRQLIA